MSAKHLGLAVEIIPALCGITVSERNVLIVLANRADADTGQCFPSRAYIGDRTGMSESTIKRALAALVDRGFIGAQSRRRENGAQTSNLYTVDFFELSEAFRLQVEQKDKARTNRKPPVHHDPHPRLMVTPPGGSPCTPIKQEDNTQEENTTLSHARDAQFEVFSQQVRDQVGDDGDWPALDTRSLQELFDLATMAPDDGLVCEAVRFAVHVVRQSGGKLKSWSLATEKAREYLAMFSAPASDRGADLHSP